MMDSWFGRVLLIPTAVFLSAIFGASYGSGREVVEFVSSQGPTGGLVALLTVAMTHSVLLILSFEIARLFKTYEYTGFCRVLLGRFWFLYEIVILMGLIIALSITTTVGGTVLEDRFGIALWIGTLLIFGIVVGLNYFGRKIVEESMIFSIVALFLVLVVLIAQLLDGHTSTIADSFASEPHQSGGIMTGLKYAIGGGGYLPLLLYCAMGLRTRGEAIAAGLFAAIIAVIPATIFHFAFMAGYPDVISERLPTYWMFNNVSTPLMLNIYVVVMFVLVAQTGVALMHGFIERIDAWQERKDGRPMSRTAHGSVAAVMVVASMALGSMGIVALILRGYTIMYSSFIVVYVIPLITYGAYLVFRSQPESD